MILKEADASRPRVGAVLDAGETPALTGKMRRFDDATQAWHVVVAHRRASAFSADVEPQTSKEPILACD